MALVRDGLWGFVSGTEKEPEEENERRKFLAKRDRALATIVLAIDPELLYLIGSDPDNQVVVWKKLQDQFQKKTWASKLALRGRLHSAFERRIRSRKH
jgi:predicted NBD/HSP70 family sugar kinase